MHSDDADGGAPVLLSDEQLWRALVRHSRGELTPAESAQLEQWAATDPERSALVRNVARIVATSDQIPIPRRAPAALVRLRARMREAERAQALRLVSARAPRRSYWRPTAIGLGLAACLGALVVGGRAMWDAIMAREPAPVVLRELVTQRGERATLTLADGSHVVLGPASRLRYPTSFGARERNVYLEGEAFFTVAHDVQHPFTVYSGQSAAQAVGTAFSVRRYSVDTAVQVTVTEGRVALRLATVPRGTGTLVEHGERGVLDATGLVRVEQGVDVAQATAWTEGRLSYQLTPLSAVIQDLERWYDLDITVQDSSLLRVRVTVTLEQASGADAIRRLSDVLGVHYVRQGKRVQLTS